MTLHVRFEYHIIVPSFCCTLVDAEEEEEEDDDKETREIPIYYAKNRGKT